MGKAMRYADMSHGELLRLRESLPGDHPLQATLAPLEHAAFAREWTTENPAVAIPALAVSIPGYSLAKLLGLGGDRTTPASLAEVAQSYKGMGRGLVDRMQGRQANQFAAQPRPQGRVNWWMR